MLTVEEIRTNPWEPTCGIDGEGEPMECSACRESALLSALSEAKEEAKSWRRTAEKIIEERDEALQSLEDATEATGLAGVDEPLSLLDAIKEIKNERDDARNAAKISTPCPTCGGSLFIGAGGHLTCSFIGCKEPGVQRAWNAALARVGEAERLLRKIHTSFGLGGLDMNDGYEIVSAEFEKETGLMSPGKDQPAAMNGFPTLKQREDAWYNWCAIRRREVSESLRAFLSAPADGGDRPAPAREEKR